MSASDKKRNSTLLTYIGITIFCAVFAVIYEWFSHGVYSVFMCGMFLIPLAGGVLPALLAGFFSRPSVPVRELWHSGVAAWTVGSCMQGVFEIYGTTSALVAVYWIAGGLLLLTAAVLYIGKSIVSHRE